MRRNDMAPVESNSTSTRSNVVLTPVDVPKAADVLARDLRERILSGELPEGVALPAERELAKNLGVSRPTIVKALRSRYDGRVRNPWNEYECGNYYARAMASYALLGALSGFRYSAVQRTLWFGPRLNVLPFKTFFSTASSFGTITLDSRSLRIQVIEGELRLEKMVLTDRTQTRTLNWEITIRPSAPEIKNI